MNDRPEQHRNISGRDMAGRDIVHNYTGRPTQLERLAEEFKKEYEQDVKFRQTIDILEHFIEPLEPEDPVGLKRKLRRAGRQREYDEAVRQKELFVKKLERFRLYRSAQEIFAYILGLIHESFRAKVRPALEEGATGSELDQIVFEELLQPILTHINGNTLIVSITEVRGMLYFLTGNCHVDWD